MHLGTSRTPDAPVWPLCPSRPVGNGGPPHQSHRRLTGAPLRAAPKRAPYCGNRSVRALQPILRRPFGEQL
eukprot:624445-Alexandrium_andersonii.AAC.1